MAFTKRTLRPFNTRTIDFLFDFENPFIQNGVIAGPYYTANQVSTGLPKPSYLQSTEYSDKVIVTGDSETPLRLVFALGLHDANTGGEIGAWRTFTAKNVANVEVTVDTPASSNWIYAEINKNGFFEDPSQWTINFNAINNSGKEYYYQVSEPTGASIGDIWFDVSNNLLTEYNSANTSWVPQPRVYLGEVGIGANNTVYSVKSWFPNIEYARFQDSFYTPYNENPWRHWDGVSFLTDGQYTAMEASQWANSFVVGESVASSPIAMAAIANSATAMDVVVSSPNTYVYIAQTAIGMWAIGGNTNAMNVFGSNSEWMSLVANNSVSLTGVSNSQFQFGVTNSSFANAFYNEMVTDTDHFGILCAGLYGNILFEMITQSGLYTTITGNTTLKELYANSNVGPILATGGTVTTITEGGVPYRVHKYNASNPFAVLATGESASTTEYLVVAGGGGGGQGVHSPWQGHGGGGGGAGGYRVGTGFTVSKQDYPITVGAGGAAAPTPASPQSQGPGANGSPSIFSTIVASGGGGGGANSSYPAHPGGSGGGTSQGGATNPAPQAGAAAEPGGQGNPGGLESGSPPSVVGTATLREGFYGGGGGGAGEPGAFSPAWTARETEVNLANTTLRGQGGNGLSSSIDGTPTFRAGGGGGYRGGNATPAWKAPGGLGGGGKGATSNTTAVAATNNTGGGGGGAHYNGASAGAPGIVIIRYPTRKV